MPPLRICFKWYNHRCTQTSTRPSRWRGCRAEQPLQDAAPVFLCRRPHRFWFYPISSQLFCLDGVIYRCLKPLLKKFSHFFKTQNWSAVRSATLPLCFLHLLLPQFVQFFLAIGGKRCLLLFCLYNGQFFGIRDPIYAPMVSFFYRHYTVQSVTW